MNADECVFCDECVWNGMLLHRMHINAQECVGAKTTRIRGKNHTTPHVAAGPDGGGYRAAPGPEVSVQKCKLGASEW